MHCHGGAVIHLFIIFICINVDGWNRNGTFTFCYWRECIGGNKVLVVASINLMHSDPNVINVNFGIKPPNT